MVFCPILDLLCQTNCVSFSRQKEQNIDKFFPMGQLTNKLSLFLLFIYNFLGV